MPLPSAAEAPKDPAHRPMPRRMLYAAFGVLAVTIGAVGVFLPGVPTTFPLIVAIWCFSRSFPSLEQRLIRVPLFRPYLRYLDRSEPMPLRARLVTLSIMWVFVGLSLLWMQSAGAPLVASGVTVALALIGSWFIWGLGKSRVAPEAETAPVPVATALIETKPRVLLERSMERPDVPTHPAAADAHVDRIGA